MTCAQSNRTPIHAIGFPGAAFASTLEDPRAEFDASNEPGEISQIKMSNWGVFFEMSALINHGDSGGPVIDRNGDVIAINVAFNNIAPGHNLAIPINAAQSFLKDAGVTPDPGLLSRLLTQSLQLLAAGKYGECRRKLIELETARVPIGGDWSPDLRLSQLESINARLDGNPLELYYPSTIFPEEDLETSKDSLDRFLKKPAASPQQPHLIELNQRNPKTPPNLVKPGTQDK
jgi:hypothetical protein